MAKVKITLRLPKKELAKVAKDRRQIKSTGGKNIATNDIIVTAALRHWYASQGVADRTRQYLLTATPYQRAA